MVKNPFLNLFGGMTQWLYQRFSAISIYFFIGYLFFYWVQIDQVNYQAWVQFFDSILHRLIITVLFLLTFFHGWIGVQHVIDDYVKHKIIHQIVYLLLLFSMMIQIIFYYYFYWKFNLCNILNLMF